MSRRSFVEEGGHIVPRVLYEPASLGPYKCRTCCDTGVLIERIDEERFDTVIPCPTCRMFCKACNKTVRRVGHKCASKEQP